jgi:hypothetical protein
MNDTQIRQMLDTLDEKLDSIRLELDAIRQEAGYKGHFWILAILLGIVMGGCPVTVGK